MDEKTIPVLLFDHSIRGKAPPKPPTQKVGEALVPVGAGMPANKGEALAMHRGAFFAGMPA
ncbi:hypothetical protein ACIQT6_13765, partial [Pseudomonas asiatica]|uniref:hypothetical protein n=1 Tax=Pseudomonas asiatica TaxID=2219225 RepID=UPI00383BB46A